jgi:uncharacterized protein (TIGR04255 family)
VTVTGKYKQAPIALALVEIRHPEGDYLSRGDLAGLKQMLNSVTPLQKAEELSEIQMTMNPGTPPVSAMRNRTMQRFSSRDRRTSITFGVDSIVVETTDYKGWEAFCALITAAISARQEVAPIDGVERIGLRFIDEIRVPRTREETIWTDWVAPSLLPPDFNSTELDLALSQQQSVVQYATSRPEETIALRYGAVDGPPTVGSGPNFVRADTPAPGLYFLLDTDAAWTLTPGAPVPEASAAGVVEIASTLHTSAKGLFEALITEKLRVEVFGLE